MEGARGRSVAEAPDAGAPGWLRALAAASLLVPFAALALRCALSPSVPFVHGRADAPWIAAPAAVSARLEQWGRSEPEVWRFERRFSARADEPGRVTVRALGDARVWCNGEPLTELARAGRRGRAEGELSLAGALRSGDNELRVEVRNALGPGLLSVSGAGLADPPTTVSGWRAARGDAPLRAAVPADDTRPHPLAAAAGSPDEALRAKAAPLGTLALLGAVGFLLAGRAPAVWRGAGLAWAALGAAVVGWIALFAARFAHIPLLVGFDARHHVLYVDRLLELGRLPLGDEGWSSYHPPLFYVLSAAVAWLGGETVALKALPWLAGLCSVVLAWWLARRAIPGRPALPALACLFAATLPVQLYSAAYFSNEALHACLAGAALVAVCELLWRPGLSRRRLVLAAALFGLAALTKFTVLVALPVALIFLAAAWGAVERAGAARTAARLGVFGAVFLAVAGWFYVRNQVELGSALLGNWALPGADQQWWQQPGFHTAGYFLGFGESLRHPYLSGFHSFWDGLYSSFWGDGFVAGRAEPTARHGFWDYQWMSLGYWLALPASAMVLAGALGLAGRALAPGPARERLGLGFLLASSGAVALAFLALTIDLPFYSQAKAPYLLMLSAPLSLMFANGFAELDRWLTANTGPLARALLYAWLAAWAGTLVLGFS